MDDDKGRDTRLLLVGGAAFIALAGFFLWRDLDLPRELMLLAAAVVAGGAAALGLPRRWPALAPAAQLATTAGGALWFLADKRPSLLPALAVAAAASLVTVVRSEAGALGAGPLPHRIRWYGLGAALLAASWGLYFHFFTTGVAADSVARRLIPTLVWLALGLALFIAGRRRSPAGQVGLGLTAIALVKAAAYDTTHLAGGLRVTVLAAVGALLLFAAGVLDRRRPGAPPDAADAREGTA
jgi:hypothetical protein